MMLRVMMHVAEVRILFAVGITLIVVPIFFYGVTHKRKSALYKRVMPLLKKLLIPGIALCLPMVYYVYLDLCYDVSEFTENDMLFLAVEKDDYSAAKKLMDMGADPADNCRYGISPIYRAVMEKNSEALEMYLAGGADPNFTGECNITLLGTACADGSEDIAKILLDAGADPNYGPYAYIPALHYAAMNDEGFNYSLVKLLIENGADPSARIYDHGKEMLPFRYYFDRFSDAVLHGTITDAEREDFARISELLYEPYADRLVERVENIRGKKEDEYETIS